MAELSLFGILRRLTGRNQAPSHRKNQEKVGSVDRSGLSFRGGTVKIFSTQVPQDRKVTNIFQKISESVRLLIKHWGLFSLIVLTVWLPGTVAIKYFSFYVYPAAGELETIAREVRLSNSFEAIAGPIYIGALIYALSELKQGHSVTYPQAISFGVRRWGRLFAARFWVGLLVLLGLVCFVVPGIVLALQFALIDSVATLERVNSTVARKRSYTLTRGKRWQILGAVVLTIVGVLITLSLIAVVLYLPVTLAGQTDNFWVAIVYDCIASVLLSILTILLFLFYWEARSQEQQDTLPSQ